MYFCPIVDSLRLRRQADHMPAHFYGWFYFDFSLWYILVMGKLFLCKGTLLSVCTVRLLFWSWRKLKCAPYMISKNARKIDLLVRGSFLCLSVSLFFFFLRYTLPIIISQTDENIIVLSGITFLALLLKLVIRLACKYVFFSSL